jgi:hypothetical protein
MAMTSAEILALPMDHNDAGATTIQAYLQALLVTLWQEEESFSGKRPFGNSDWQWDVYKALVKGGAVPGKVDDDDLQELDEKLANEVMLEVIEAMTAVH